MAETEHKWFGNEIAKEIERATVEGLEAVAADFVRTAHPLDPDTGPGVPPIAPPSGTPVEHHADVVDALH